MVILYHIFKFMGTLFYILLWHIRNDSYCSLRSQQQMHRNRKNSDFNSYCLSSIPICSKPFKIFFMAAFTSLSSSVLSLARKVME